MPLVSPSISARKLDRELAAWDEQAAGYRQRGYAMVGRSDLTVEVAFFARLPIGQRAEGLPIAVACARLDFINYDVWPPSVVFIDVLSGVELAVPDVAALEFHSGAAAGAVEAQSLVLGPHPTTGRAFLCQAGVREYHSHPEHTGDDWLLHRGSGQGTLASICERLWILMARSVVGVQVGLQQLPGGAGRAVQVVLAQGDPDALEAQLAGARAQGLLGVPSVPAAAGQEGNDESA